MEKIISNQDDIYTYNENEKPKESFTSALNAYANILLANPQDHKPIDEINAQSKKKPKKFFFTHQASKPQNSNIEITYAQILSQPTLEHQENNQPVKNHNHSPSSDTVITQTNQPHTPDETTHPTKKESPLYTEDKDTKIMKKIENTTNKLEDINKNYIKAMERIAS